MTSLNPPLRFVACLALVVCACDDNKTPSPHAVAATSKRVQDAGIPPDAATSDAAQDDDDDDAGASDGSSALQAQLNWVLATIAHGGDTSEQELAQHFDPGALAALTAPQLKEDFKQLGRQLNPFHVTDQVQIAPTHEQVELETVGGPLVVTIECSASEPHLITLLSFAAGKIVPSPTSYDQAITQLRDLAPERALLVAEIKDGSCEPTHELDSKSRLAIGSAFKLWVLLALDTKLRDDPSVTWDDKLAIRDELKSLPSGTFQDEPAGAQHTLREFAEHMISISDNTAADHLLDFVGRAAVESSQSDSQHSDPTSNIPWLSTREAFALKFWASQDLVAAYRNGNVDAKRKLLDQLRSLPLDLSKLENYTSPRLIDIEWFASPRDTCNVLATLGARAGFDPQSPLFKVLSINSGLPVDKHDWTFVGFKGGSEVGVVHASWLLQRADGRWFSVVMTINDPRRPVDEDAFINTAHGLLDILGRER